MKTEAKKPARKRKGPVDVQARKALMALAGAIAAIAETLPSQHQDALNRFLGAVAELED